MQGLIDGLLTYAHVQTRAKPFAPTPCEAVLANVKANLHLAIAESGAVITNDALPIVVADQLQMVQLFQNLVGNALKYRAKEAPRIHIGSRTEKKEWFFSVRDNGIGLDMKFAQRVFVVFQRLHSIEEYQGTGIGLSICKRIVERHGGRIWVESVPDQGATFSFTISRAPA
jgi:light-regulated signal transduction histidine kinase (bacteriophytochrome)